MTLKKGVQLVLMQGWYNKPIEADAEWSFLRSNPVQIALDDKTRMGEASPIPEFLIPAHHRALGYSGKPRVYDPQKKTITELA